jgi:hypothetical protein
LARQQTAGVVFETQAARTHREAIMMTQDEHIKQIVELSETIVEAIDETATDGRLELNVVVGALLEAVS